MRKTQTCKVYNLVNVKGAELRMELGMITEGLRDEYPIDSKDKGFRWRFVGKEIPMPVRSEYWFNGFPEETMLEWLKANGWYPKTCVDMYTGKAKVYTLPTVNGDGIPELEIEISAQEAYDDTIPVALENAMKKISEAKDNGYTSCYISSIKGKIPTEVIQSLLDAGYDIKYNAFNMGYGDWFIEAFWSNPREKGKLFKGSSFDNPIEVSIQDYKNA